MLTKPKPDTYIGKMYVTVNIQSRVVTGMGWIDDDGQLPHSRVDRRDGETMYIVDRFFGDKMPNIITSRVTYEDFIKEIQKSAVTVVRPVPTIASKYPQYYKDVRGYDFLDVYAVHSVFGINDPSGCIQHASKKLLLSGTRTGGKSAYDDIREARDTLNRYLELHPQPNDSNDQS